jgi:hypothetical protein
LLSLMGTRQRSPTEEYSTQGIAKILYQVHLCKDDQIGTHKL